MAIERELELLLEQQGEPRRRPAIDQLVAELQRSASTGPDFAERNLYNDKGLPA